jgi:hypothetical protein
LACVAAGAGADAAAWAFSQVALTDGRVLFGQLQCADKQGNLVLHSTRELLPNRRARALQRRRYRLP